ncbi:MAG: phosphatase PAP2 family protein [Bacteroidia bacterium]|nr:phosphatase PAP2 family protein [Bacteroidia bacterium]
MIRRFFPHDKLILLYLLLTAIITIAGYSQLHDAWQYLLTDGCFAVVIILISYADSRCHNQIIGFLHNFYPLLFLGWFYGETGYLNNLLFNDLDQYFQQFEQYLFGCQPSIEFSLAFPSKWFSELMNFGYFSYYLLALTTCLSIYFIKQRDYQHSLFIIIASFFIYYLIFIIFPVVGPQFSFHGINAKIPDSGFFWNAVKFVQKAGEKPTGAFPSSHVGMSLIFLALTYRHVKTVFFIILPVVVILLFATVYIKAHYMVDVIAGFITAPFFYYISNKLYFVFNNHSE